jgi:hypothetical protein
MIWNASLYVTNVFDEYGIVSRVTISVSIPAATSKT